MSRQISEALLEEYLLEYIQTIFGPTARAIGQQRALPSGKIPDLLVLIPEHQVVMVVEVKAKKARRAAVGQLLSYVGELRQRAVVCHADCCICYQGFIAAPEIDDSARYALVEAGLGFIRTAWASADPGVSFTAGVDIPAECVTPDHRPGQPFGDPEALFSLPGVVELSLIAYDRKNAFRCAP